MAVGFAQHRPVAGHVFEDFDRRRFGFGVPDLDFVCRLEGILGQALFAERGLLAFGGNVEGTAERQLHLALLCGMAHAVLAEKYCTAIAMFAIDSDDACRQRQPKSVGLLVVETQDDLRIEALQAAIAAVMEAAAL